jgi:hypothetical protein
MSSYSYVATCLQAMLVPMLRTRQHRNTENELAPTRSGKDSVP